MLGAACLVGWLAVTPAAQDPPPAQAEAVEAWNAGDWPRAAEAFGRAFEADPRPEYLWSRAQALRLADDCPAAIEVYEAFIALDPPDLDRRTAQTNIARCKSALADRAEPPPPEPVGAQTAPAAPAPPARRDAVRPWYADPTGIGLFSVGVVAAAVGGGLMGYADRSYRTADDAASEQDYRQQVSASRNTSAAGIACLAAGGALIVGSVVRFAVVHRRNRARTSRLDGALTVHF